MTKTTCDYCQKEHKGDSLSVHVRGVRYYKSGKGILLPDSMMNQDFCDPACFWAWANHQLKENPETI
jgi:hypothetical protein